MTLAEYEQIISEIEAAPHLAALAGDPIFYLRKAQRELEGALWQPSMKPEVMALAARARYIMERIDEGSTV